MHNGALLFDQTLPRLPLLSWFLGLPKLMDVEDVADWTTIYHYHCIIALYLTPAPRPPVDGQFIDAAFAPCDGKDAVLATEGWPLVLALE